MKGGNTKKDTQAQQKPQAPPIQNIAGTKSGLLPNAPPQQKPGLLPTAPSQQPTTAFGNQPSTLQATKPPAVTDPKLHPTNVPQAKPDDKSIFSQVPKQPAQVIQPKVDQPKVNPFVAPVNQPKVEPNVITQPQVDDKKPLVTQPKPEDKKQDPIKVARQESPKKVDVIPPVVQPQQVPAKKPEEQKGQFKLSGGLPSAPAPAKPAEQKPLFDTSKGFGNTQDTSGFGNNQAPSGFGNNQASPFKFDTSKGFGNQQAAPTQFDTSKGFGNQQAAPTQFDTSKGFGTPQPAAKLDLSKGFGTQQPSANLDPSKGFGTPQPPSQPGFGTQQPAKFDPSLGFSGSTLPPFKPATTPGIGSGGFPSVSQQSKTQWSSLSFAEIIKQGESQQVKPVEAPKPIYISPEEQKKIDKQKKEEEKKKQEQVKVNQLKPVQVIPPASLKVPGFKPDQKVEQSATLTAQEKAKKEIEDQIAKERKSRLQKDEEVIVEQQPDEQEQQIEENNLEIQKIMMLEEKINAAIKQQSFAAIDSLETEDEQMAELQRLIQIEEDMIKQQTQSMENQKRNAKRKMTKYAQLQIDNILLEKQSLKNIDPIVTLNQQLSQDLKYNQILLKLRDLQIEEQSLKFIELQKDEEKKENELKDLTKEVLDLDVYIQSSIPMTDKIVKENDIQRMVQSEFLKKTENIQEHVSKLNMECDQWLEDNEYQPLEEVDIKKWEFSKEEKRQKQELTKSEKDTMLEAIDCKLKIQVAQKTNQELNSTLWSIEHKQQLLKEDIIDLNQLEKMMTEALEKCGITYQSIVETKYYPKRRHLQYI